MKCVSCGQSDKNKLDQLEDMICCAVCFTTGAIFHHLFSDSSSTQGTRSLFTHLITGIYHEPHYSEDCYSDTRLSRVSIRVTIGGPAQHQQQPGAGTICHLRNSAMYP